MKTVRLTLAVLLAGTTAFATAAFAQEALDADGDGMVSLEELQAVYADFAAEDFAQVDIDGDGLLNGDEMALATESGMIPAQEKPGAETSEKNAPAGAIRRGFCLGPGPSQRTPQSMRRYRTGSVSDAPDRPAR